jgi:hypothetical protein
MVLEPRHLTNNRFSPFSLHWSGQQDQYSGRSISLPPSIPFNQHSLRLQLFLSRRRFPPQRSPPRHFLPRRGRLRPLQHLQLFKDKHALLTHRKCAVKDPIVSGFLAPRGIHSMTIHKPTCQNLHVGGISVGGTGLGYLAVYAEIPDRLARYSKQVLLISLVAAQRCFVERLFGMLVWIKYHSSRTSELRRRDILGNYYIYLRNRCPVE